MYHDVTVAGLHSNESSIAMVIAIVEIGNIVNYQTSLALAATAAWYDVHRADIDDRAFVVIV